jgi:hypothetical protein
MCVRQHGDAPEVTLHGRLDLTFAYVAEHVHYILLELLKNSMRCVFFGGGGLYVCVYICMDNAPRAIC